MGLFGGDSKSKSKTTVSSTTTQVDRRVAGSDSARVATEGSKIVDRRTSSVRVNSADAKVISAALAGSTANFREALSFSARQSDRDARTVEAALAQTGGDLGGLQSLVKGGVTAAIALAVVAFLAFRR